MKLQTFFLKKIIRKDTKKKRNNGIMEGNNVKPLVLSSVLCHTSIFLTSVKIAIYGCLRR